MVELGETALQVLQIQDDHELDHILLDEMQFSDDLRKLERVILFDLVELPELDLNQAEVDELDFIK